MLLRLLGRLLCAPKDLPARGLQARVTPQNINTTAISRVTSKRVGREAVEMVGNSRASVRYRNCRENLYLSCMRDVNSERELQVSNVDNTVSTEIRGFELHRD